jgi:glycosyltransferase involved in cell wall biosynthesis
MGPTPLHQKIAFVAHAGTIAAPIPAGVQLCTQEFLGGLTLAGFDIRHFAAPLSTSLVKRLKQRLGVYGLARGEILAAAPALIRFVEEEGVEAVVINMANLAPFAAALRARFGPALRIALISHGNESGDHLKQLALGPHGIAHWHSTYRLGRELVDESRDRDAIDHVFCLSETEREIEHWLGAGSVTFVPRLVRPAPLSWRPEPGRVGYVGTLDHLPNREGLRQLLAALAAAGERAPAVRLVGGPACAAEQIVREHSGVEYLGPLDRAELEREAATWSVFIHPLFWHSRGASMKVAQALAWGIPIVTTEPGIRGYLWSKGGVVLARTPAEMAAIVRRCVWSRDTLTAMAADVRAAAETSPAPEAIAARLREGLTRPASAA